MINFRKTVHSRAVAKMADVPETELPVIVITGKSNVGKSSLINRLCGQNNLARVSQTPGKTRLLHFFTCDDAFTIVDVPGFGYAKVNKSARAGFGELTDQFLQSKVRKDLIIHLLDVRHEPSELDLMMIEWLCQSGCQWGLVLTKSDKVNQQQVSRFCNQLKKEYGDRISLLLAVSASKGNGIQALRSGICSLFGEEARLTD